MNKKSSSARSPHPRIPPEAAGIQVNFCKNPRCANFGVPASQTSGHRMRGKERDVGAGEAYSVVTAGKRHYPALRCHLCGEHPPLKSNLGIAEELFRLSDYLRVPMGPSCPTGNCPNHGLPVEVDPTVYYRFGRTRGGSQRYQCTSCGTTFSVSRATRKHRLPHKNKQVFSLLMNKAPFRRILEVTGISAPALYGKIDFLHRQCLGFVAERERRLADTVRDKRLEISVDRQDYVVNWNRRDDRRNVVLHAAGSAENRTGYVFSMDLNFDPSMHPETIEEKAVEQGDYYVPPCYRRYARLWLKGDYDESVVEYHARQARKRGGGAGLRGRISDAYSEADVRSDVEVSEVKNESVRLPQRGMQVHAEYSLYGHFFHLRRLLGEPRKIAFYVDQDSGMRAACLAGFQPSITAHSVDAFYVRVAKEKTIGEKRTILARSRAEFQRWREEHPDLDDLALQLTIIRAQMTQMPEIGQWKDRWLAHPFPNMSEPEKAICALTDLSDQSPDRQAWMYRNASLHGIDRFFMQVRRRLSLLERAIGSASTARRMWYGYSAYNPEMIVKVLDIFRVYYNYVVKGQDGKTPAMRMGLARGPVHMEDILYWSRTTHG